MPLKEGLIEDLQQRYGIHIDALITDIKRYMLDLNEKKFRRAFEFAAEAHDGQLRKDNSPYIIHPFEAVKILVSLQVDEETLISAFLHDVPEDTSRTISDIEKIFGKKIAFLVDGITKLAKVHYQHNMAERQIESLKKLFIHTAQDPRIILIKLADRLHNMRTLKFVDKEEKRIRIARETLEIFVPIANLLGIEELKSELEDLCFQFLFPDEFATLSERMKHNREKNLKFMDQTIEIVEQKFKESHINATVYGRQKHLYGVYKKMIGQCKRIDEFDDLISIRILVGTKDECYKALGIIHSLFKPKASRFCDYIAVPKSNGYQSLHTCVFGVNGLPTEFQIRTNSMHLEAEYGVAAHYFDDHSKDKRHLLEEDKRSFWVEKILQMQKKEAVNDHFIEELKHDVFRDRIFVFTPKGRSVDLPQDATCIDFAYQIHTEIGNRALKAEMNGQIVPMATMLHNGDMVRIILSDFPKGPSRAWLAFAKTGLAKNKIREYFKRTSREVKLASGRTLLQKELDRSGLGLIKNVNSKKVKVFLEKYPQYKSTDDVLIAIGDGSISTLDFMRTIYPQKTATLGNMRYFDLLLRRKRMDYTPVSIKIVSRDAVGQLEKILKVASLLHLNILETKAYISIFSKNFICRQIVAINNFSQVSELFENLEQIEGVKRVERLFWIRKFLFTLASIITFSVWAIHPFLLRSISSATDGSDILISNLGLYGGLFMLMFMVLMLKNLTNRSFPELRETNFLWGITLMLTIFAVITLLAEVYFFQIRLNWLVVSVITVLITAYLANGYIRVLRKNS